MKIALFGATGKTGQHLLKQALVEGHEVRALVRDESKLATRNEHLSSVPGDALDAAKVEDVVAGTEAVLLVLGHTKTSPPDMLTTATGYILKAMQKHGVRRLVCLTGAGVSDPKDEPKLINHLISFLLKIVAGKLLEDSVRQIQLVRASERDWVVVRAPRLTDKPQTGQIRVGMVGKGTGALISRADVAAFMLNQLTDDTYLGQMPVISH